ncbi:MAG: ATP-binding protein [Acidiferrobacterales bacterium]
MLELINAIFDSGSYANTVTAWAPRITALFILALGAYVFWRERASRIGIQYFLFEIAVFLYLFTVSFQMASLNPDVAMFWARTTQIGVLLMYPTVYQFGVIFIGYEERKRKLVIAAWILAGIFILINVTTDLYINEMYQYWWGRYVKFGWLPTSYLSLSSFFVLTGLMYIVQVYRRSPVGTIQHKRAKGMLWGFGFGVITFVDTIPAYGFDFYPFGFAGLLMHAIVFATLTWRYRLVGITPEFAAKEIIDTMTDALLVLDNNKIIRLANPEAARLFQCDERELLNKPVLEALTTAGLPEDISKLTQGETVKKAEVRFTNARGDSRIMNVSVSVMHEGGDKAIAYTCVLRDITEQNRIQGELERRVVERTAELAVARDQALEASRTKSAFLANMSHELRTPLNAIIGYSEMLYEDVASFSKKQVTEDLQKISSAGSHLLELINSVLDLSKIEAGKMELHNEKFSIEELASEVADVFRPLAEQNGNELRMLLPRGLGAMVADRTKVNQVLMNLVSNACKFTNDGIIEIEAERSVSGALEWICISVRDNGIGISPLEQEKLFSEFTQASTSIPKIYGGTGLGLSISQKLCQLMGGAITVESEPDVGTEFTICLPADVPRAIAANHSEDAAIREV